MNLKSEINKLWSFLPMFSILTFLLKFSLQICPQLNHVRNGNFSIFKNLTNFMNATQSFKYNQFLDENGWYIKNSSSDATFMVRTYLNQTQIGLQVFNSYNAYVCQDYTDLQTGQMYEISYGVILDNNSADVLHQNFWNGILVLTKNIKKANPGFYNLNQIVVAQSGINTLCFYNKLISVGLHKNTTGGSGNGGGGGGGNGNKNSGGGGGNTNTINNTNIVTGSIVDNITLVKLIKKNISYQISSPIIVQTVNYINITINNTANNSNSSNLTTNITIVSYKYQIKTNFATINPSSYFLNDKIYINGIQATLQNVAIYSNDSFIEYIVLLLQPAKINPIVKIVLANNIFRTSCGQLVYLDCSIQENYQNTEVSLSKTQPQKLILKTLIFSMQMIRTIGFSLVVMQFITLSNILILYIFTDIAIIPQRVKNALQFASVILLRNGIISNIYELINDQIFQGFNTPLKITNDIPDNYKTKGSQFNLIDLSYNLISICIQDIIIMNWNIIKLIGLIYFLKFFANRASKLKLFYYKIKESSDEIILFEIISPSSVWMILPGLLFSQLGQYISTSFFEKINFMLIIIYPIIFIILSVSILLNNIQRNQKNNYQTVYNFNKQKYSSTVYFNFNFKNQVKPKTEKQQKIFINSNKNNKCEQIMALIQNLHFIFIGFFIGTQSLVLYFVGSLLINILKIFFFIRAFKNLKWYINFYIILSKSIQIVIFFIFLFGHILQNLIPNLWQNEKLKQVFEFFCCSLLYLYISGLTLQIIYTIANIVSFFINICKNFIKISNIQKQVGTIQQNKQQFQSDKVKQINDNSQFQNNIFSQKIQNNKDHRVINGRTTKKVFNLLNGRRSDGPNFSCILRNQKINLKLKQMSKKIQNKISVNKQGQVLNNQIDKIIKINLGNRQLINNKIHKVKNPLCQISNNHDKKQIFLPLNIKSIKVTKNQVQQIDIQQNINLDRNSNSFEEKIYEKNTIDRKKRRTSSKT